MELVLNINNKNVTVNVPTDEMLLDTLRNLGYYSVRCGCDTTNCGLCTVWVDDEIVLSCAYPTFRAPGHKITTLEGLEEEAELLAACIASEGGDQCGFCTTGMMMSAINLKRKIQRLVMMKSASTSLVTCAVVLAMNHNFEGFVNS